MPLERCYYAELRALEHAMNYVVKREEPKQVVLGDLDDLPKEESSEEVEAKFTARLAEAQRQLNREKDDKERLKQDLRKVGDAYQKVQAQAVELSQTAMRLQRRLSQSTSTFGVLIFAMGIVIVVLLVANYK